MIDLVKLFRKTINIDLSYKLTPYPEYYPDDEPIRRLASIEKAREHLNFNPKDLRTYLKFDNNFNVKKVFCMST